MEDTINDLYIHINKVLNVMSPLNGSITMKVIEDIRNTGKARGLDNDSFIEGKNIGENICPQVYL